MPAPFVPYPHDMSVRTQQAFHQGYDDAYAQDESFSWLSPKRHQATILAYLAGRDEGGRYTARQAAVQSVQAPDAQTP